MGDFHGCGNEWKNDESAMSVEYARVSDIIRQVKSRDTLAVTPYFPAVER